MSLWNFIRDLTRLYHRVRRGVFSSTLGREAWSFADLRNWSRVSQLNQCFIHCNLCCKLQYRRRLIFFHSSIPPVDRSISTCKSALLSCYIYSTIALVQTQFSVPLCWEEWYTPLCGHWRTGLIFSLDCYKISSTEYISCVEMWLQFWMYPFQVDRTSDWKDVVDHHESYQAKGNKSFQRMVIQSLVRSSNYIFSMVLPFKTRKCRPPSIQLSQKSKPMATLGVFCLYYFSISWTDPY